MAPAAIVWSRPPPTLFPSRIIEADLVLFVFSLHHVPAGKLAGALAEARRVLRPSGRLYVAEPLAQGPHQYVMELFHDETAVRKPAAEALANFAAPRFPTDQISTYTDRRSFPTSTPLPSA